MRTVMEKEPLFECSECQGDIFRIAREPVVNEHGAHLIATCYSCHVRHLIRVENDEDAPDISEFKDPDE